MKICFINTFSHTGGASMAAIRLAKALREVGHEVTFLCYYKNRGEDWIVELADNWWKRQWRFLNFVNERLWFLPYEKSKKERFFFSPANFGVDIVNHPAVREADVVHLHWVNRGFLSLKSLSHLLGQKPAVWTLHDFWAFTGGCHYSGDCTRYQLACGQCPFLKNPRSKDHSNFILNKKNKGYQKAKSLEIVTCSEWLGKIAESSALLQTISVQSIPNTIDTSFFIPKNKKEIRTKLGLPLDKKMILFVAMNTNDERKGFIYFKEALAQIDNENYELLVIGKADENVLNQLFKQKIHYKGLIRSEAKMVDIYNASDVYVTPTLQDNLPNTVMESLACGLPVVAFETGGVPEMVQHEQTGYIAPQKNAGALANGIKFVLENPDRYKALAKTARSFTLENYSASKVVPRYEAVYRKAIMRAGQKSM